MVFEVHVRDEFAVGNVIFWFLLVFQRVKREHIKAVNLLHVSFGLRHADLVNLATECLTSLRGHSVEISGEKDLPVVGVA